MLFQQSLGEGGLARGERRIEYGFTRAEVAQCGTITRRQGLDRNDVVRRHAGERFQCAGQPLPFFPAERILGQKPAQGGLGRTAALQFVGGLLRRSGAERSCAQSFIEQRAELRIVILTDQHLHAERFRDPPRVEGSGIVMGQYNQGSQGTDR